MSKPATNTATSKDGTTIAYDRYGDGPALIFVSGATVIRAYETGLATTLAPHFTVYAFDRRGRGDSGDKPPYAVEREIEDLDAIIQAAGGSAFILGHSSGAVLALRAAAHGLAIPKLAIYEPPFGPGDEENRQSTREYAEQLNALLAEDRRGDAMALFMMRVGMPQEMIDQMRQDPSWEAMEAVSPTLAYDSAVMGDAQPDNPLLSGPWRSITTPTLVMDGGASPDSMRNAARALADILPNAQHRTLEGQDHGPADDVLAPMLVEFFNDEASG